MTIVDAHDDRANAVAGVVGELLQRDTTIERILATLDRLRKKKPRNAYEQILQNQIRIRRQGGW